MSSYFDDASLVMIPSGYKTSKVYSVKPTDGTGDLTFTRSNSTASRVASNGLIEKVRTNLVLQSNSFDTTWGATGSTVSSGQSGYDGTTNAWLLTRTGTSGYLSQNSVQSTLGVVSVYAKANVNSWFRIRVSATASSSAFFDLSNGTLGIVTSGQTATITSVGNGWYRCTLTYSPTSSDVRLYVADADGDVSGSSGSVFIQAAQWELGDIATDPILTTTAAVSVGPVANVPRLDYLNSSCPRLLLEPQRTNVCLWSEQFDNAGWTKENATITANAVTSPSGYQDADTLTDNSTSGRHRVAQTMSATNGTTYTYSVFVKKNSSGRFLLINAATLINARAALNLDTLAVTNLNGTGKVEDYGNGWYRFSVTGTATATSSTATYIQMQNSASDVNYVGNGSSFYLWGAQFEQGSYVSSYIGPTLGAAVTRGADACSKTGISSLIGQTEGTLFFEGTIEGENSAVNRRVFTISDGTTSNAISIQNPATNRKIEFEVTAGGVTQALISAANNSLVYGQKFKAAIAYKANDFVAYINGVQIGTDTSGSVPACSKVSFDRGNSTSPFEGATSQTLLFKTRLPNSSLAELTSL